MPSSPQAVGERAFKHFVSGLHKNQGRTPAPWFHAGIAFTQADIPRLTQQFRAAVDCAVWFAEQGWGELPLSLEECMDKIQYEGGLGFLLAGYSRSLWCVEYDYLRHPKFGTYCNGVLAHPNAPKCLRDDLVVQAQFTPRALVGLDYEFCWCPLPHRAGA
jgi:hypothetical protein